MSATEYVNIHGRRWGRGIRPWLLVPKVICVSVFLGGLVSVLVLGYLPAPPATHEGWLDHARFLRRAYVCVIVPALVGAMFMGLLLLSAHFTALIRMRWMQVKLVLMAVFVPSMHTYMQNRSIALREVLESNGDLALAGTLRGDMLAGNVATLAFALAAMFLGRVKPRLGQRYGRTFARAVPGDATSAEPPRPSRADA